MMIINVITIVIVIMRAKTIRIACVQRIAPYSYLLIIFIINSSTLSITITCMPTSSHGGAQLILKSSQTWVETELVVSCDVNLYCHCFPRKYHEHGHRDHLQLGLKLNLWFTNYVIWHS